jgi:hypothetical protein
MSIAERKAKGVTESAPSEWCWFDCIDPNSCKHCKGRQFTLGGDMEILAGNSHQNIEEANHHTKLECEEILP